MHALARGPRYAGAVIALTTILHVKTVPSDFIVISMVYIFLRSTVTVFCSFAWTYRTPESTNSGPLRQDCVRQADSAQDTLASPIAAGRTFLRERALFLPLCYTPLSTQACKSVLSTTTAKIHQNPSESIQPSN